MSDKISYVTKLGFGFFILFFAACASHTLESHSNDQPPRLLVLGIDGISYSTFKRLQEGGHFRQFSPVAPMVSSFPSTSDPNWDAIMGLAPEPGFTKSYFDPRPKTASGFGVEVGGLKDHVTVQPSYEKVMDFKMDGILEHLSTMIWTDTTALYWLESLEKKFFEFRGRPTYFALIINSDIVSHTEGEEAVMKYLAKIEDRVDRIQKKYQEMYGRELEVVMVSDHGNAFFSPQDIPFEKQLSEMGWRLNSTISGPKDVGFYVPEILSFGAFYCRPASVRDLAMSLAKVSHIHTTMFALSDSEIIIFGQKGLFEGKVTVDETKGTIDYHVVKGADPLEQIKYFRKGPLKFSDYFQLSSDDKYPYAVARIWEGFNKNSQVKPHILANAELGYVFGNKALRLLTNIRGFASAHGSLHRDETLGIFVSTGGPLPTIRPQDFKSFIKVPGGFSANIQH